MNNTNLTISQIAKDWKISRTSIYKKLHSWELSQNTDKTISLVEVIRIFGEPKTKVVHKKQLLSTYNEQLWTNEFFELKLELERQKTKNEHLEHIINEQKQRIQHLESALNNSLESVKELSQVRFLLEQPKSKSKKRFFWLF